tara:strand:- start:3304 stop:3630 length:327 start_codon:yes stop_codon:yes gene_type:complete
MCDPITAAIIATVTTAAVSKKFADDSASKAQDAYTKSITETKQAAATEKKTFEEKMKAMESPETPLLIANKYQKGKKGMDMLKIARQSPKGMTSVGGMNAQTGVNIAT